jgi:hypothetical protein
MWMREIRECTHSFRDVFVLAIILGFACVSIFRRDLWPLTGYPMFSHYRVQENVRVVGIALESSNGQVIWWRPRFFRYPDRLGRIFHTADGAQRLWCAAEALRLVRLEGSPVPVTALHIVERRWVHNAIHDHTLARIPVIGADGGV